MSTIQDLFQQAQFSEAAYANFSGMSVSTPIQTIEEALTTGNGHFSTAQATAFAARYQVIDQLPNTGSGFSATVFRDTTTGQYTFAVRGTELGLFDFTDLSTDLADIVSDGIAIDQVIDMYNYYQSLTHTGVYQAAHLDTSYTETAALAAMRLAAANPFDTTAQNAYTAYLANLRANGAILDNNTVVQYVRFDDSSMVLAPYSHGWVGLGLLSPAAAVDVTGHSLGGHLAMAFSRLFPNATADVVAVNGAGFNYPNPNVDILFAELHGVAGFDAGKITNVVGTAGPNVVSQHWLVLQQPAGRTDIYTESASFGTAGGHGKEQMTDSLAVYNLFAKLSPSLNTNGLQSITNILKASSNVAESSLEAAVSDLAKLFNIQSAIGVGYSRDALYQAIAAFNSPFGVAATIHSLVGMSAAAIADAAQGDIAYRYALHELNPFAAVGLNYSRFNTNGELDLYDASTHSGNMSGQYLLDRAAMLTVLIERNIQDIDFAPYSVDTVYSDAISGMTLRPLGAGHLGEGVYRQIRFGSEAANAAYYKCERRAAQCSG